MITDGIVVQRYAEAFVAYARQTCGLDKALLDLRNLKNIVMHDNPEFLEFLETPQAAYTQKCEFIDAVLKEEFSAELRQFLKLLLEKRRIDKIGDIVEYIRLTYGHAGKIRALLRTSFPLDLQLLRQIKDKLENKFQKKFMLYIDLDGSLLGGIQLVIGNKVIDGTIKRRLDELHQALMSARV
jgi:F-type H+-transporting ATPase subunit delta